MPDMTYESSTADRVAVGLGWFSIGLGLAELMAPRQVARLIGLPPGGRGQTVLRAMGAREVAAGIGVLAPGRRAPGVWSRVAGDALDLALLGVAMNQPGADRGRTLAATGMVAGVTVADWLCARALSDEEAAPDSRRGSLAERRETPVESVVTINRPLPEVYAFWRNLENFPRFMAHVERVEILDARRSLWRATAPAGMTVEWEAEIVSERENESISWRSTAGSGVENHGTVTFEPAPAGRGTEVRVRLEYVPPAGAFGRIVARIFGEEPGQQVREDLRRFKQLMETGEIPISEGQGFWRAAQPPARAEQARQRARVNL
jgi:uncharacterized membrane protein